jgi:hypothetical protein
MIPSQDAQLWAMHKLKPGDQCPFCGALLAVRRERTFFTLFRVTHWVRCSSLGCEFSVRRTKSSKSLC